MKSLQTKNQSSHIYSIPKEIECFVSIAVMFLLAISVQGCASSNNFNTMSRSEAGSLLIQQRSDEYKIRAGDQIEISVWGYDEFNTERTVSGRGVITVPLIGEIQARGLTKEEFSQNIETELSEYIQGEINLSVSITSSEGNTVSVLGSVGRPDNYEITDNASLFEILSRAGGTTDQADLRNITIYQQGRPDNQLSVDLTRILRGGNPPPPVATIYPGDIVYVPQEENVIREMSAFMRDVVLLFGLFRVFN